ncbi:Bardet-biedl syndrome 5 protein, partial [Globisporangium splendens]
MVGFSQALYLVHDGRAGVKTLLHRIRMLVIAGFTGEVNYDDNYTSGRMNTLTQVLMLGYIILVMILLVNLLIAMMGNTYSEILQESEQRWVAERANIMLTIESQCTAGRNHQDRKNYAVPLQNRHGEEVLYLQIEVNDMENWKKQGSAEQDEEGTTL